MRKMIDTNKISKQHELAMIKFNSKVAVKVAKEICRLLPHIKNVQPNITGIFTGMGIWSFKGYGIGICTEYGHQGEEIKIDGLYIADNVISGSQGDYYTFEANSELKELCELLDFLVDVNGLNCSTWQDGFDIRGVLFEHSETSNQGNPFAIPNKDYYMDSDYYRGLVKSKVPVVFVDKSK